MIRREITPVLVGLFRQYPFVTVKKGHGSRGRPRSAEPPSPAFPMWTWTAPTSGRSPSPTRGVFSPGSRRERSWTSDALDDVLYRTAKDFCAKPFEVPAGGRKRIYTSGEWPGDRSTGNGRPSRMVDLRCGSATEAEIAPGSLDAVLTDPPYYDGVRYAELMDFCHVWLRRLVADGTMGFATKSTRSHDELTGNETEGRDLEHFTEGLARVYTRMAQALKPGAPLAFTYHHNRRSAYHAARGLDSLKQVAHHVDLDAPDERAFAESDPSEGLSRPFPDPGRDPARPGPAVPT